MDMAPAAAEAAVKAGAVVEAVCVQQYAVAAVWVLQQAVCVCAAAGGGGQGNDRKDSRQPACVQQWAANEACVQQRAAASACVWQRAGAAGSTIAMGDSNGSSQPAAQLRWAAAAVVAVAKRTAGQRKNCNEQSLRRWAAVG
jgi:hypothetical protein